MNRMLSSDERAMKLMAYADGELEGDDLAEVEQWIREDAKSVLFANDLAELGAFVKQGHAAAAIKRDVDLDLGKDFTDAIMAKVEAESSRAEERKVIPLSAARAKRRNTVVWVAAGLALAASIFLVTRNKEEAPLAQTTSPLVQAPAAANVAAASTAAVEVENPGSSVSVFYLPNETTAHVTTTHVVVWVDESGGK